MASKLAISKLGKTFGELHALQAIDFGIERGEFISVVGPSGCGKTTFLRIVAGLEPASSGEVLLDGRAVHRPGTDRGFVFQNDSLLPWRTVLANAIIGREVAGAIGPDDRKRTAELLKLVGLEGFGKRHPHELSGGMKQRVSIARGMVQDPPVLLMDEPFASLDEQTRMTMGDELLRIWAATGKTIVFVTHSLTEAVYLADEVVVMSARPGRIVDHLTISLPRPRTYEMLSGETFGTLRDRIWRHIKKSA